MSDNLFKAPHHFLFSKQFGEKNFNIRLLQSSDLLRVHKWVNMPYARRFWNMTGPLDELLTAYRKQKEENIASTFLVCHDTNPIALVEVYQVISTELALKYEADIGDFGIHLLMAPHTELLVLKKDTDKISEKVLLTILDMLFSYNSVSRVVAEPDTQNHYAHRLAENAGFIFQGEIQLIEKIARLYMITKEQYQKRCNS